MHSIMTTPRQLPSPHPQSPLLRRAGRQPSSPRPLPRIPLLPHPEKRDFLTHSTTYFNRGDEITSRDSLFIAQNPRRAHPTSSIIFRLSPFTLIAEKKYLQTTHRAFRSSNSVHSTDLVA